MAYHISDECIGCGSCKAICPVDAITEGTPYKIDENKCIECGACSMQCPVSAISK